MTVDALSQREFEELARLLGITGKTHVLRAILSQAHARAVLDAGNPTETVYLRIAIHAAALTVLLRRQKQLQSRLANSYWSAISAHKDLMEVTPCQLLH